MAEMKKKEMRWQVVFYFFFLCYSVSGQINYSIFEESRTGSIVGNIAKDLGLNIRDLPLKKLRIVSHVSEKYFTVNLENGNLYVKERIDREALCGLETACSLTFEALVDNPLNVFHIIVEIQDINDNAPKFFEKLIDLEIIESAVPGSHFILENAHDLDIGINSLLNYTLSDNEHFVLRQMTSNDGSKTPELVLKKALDRETKKKYELILTASDGGRPVQTGTVVIKIQIIDLNDNYPRFSQEVYKISVKENIPTNSTVLYVKATDKDEGSNADITYSFSSIPDNILQKFSINAKTGEIKTRESLDFENTKNYEIAIQAKDGGGLSTQSKIVIQVTDENDNAPDISISSISTPISEDTKPGTVVALIKIIDQDSGSNGEVECEITNNAPFKLMSSSGNYYKIITTHDIDREKNHEYNITITATDKGFPVLASKRTITFEISDVNDNPPFFEKSTYIVYIQENNTPGSSIYSISASDPDSEENAKLIYFIFNTKTEDISESSYLSISPVTGILYAQRSFDYEQQKEFAIQIMAKDSGSPPLSSNATLRICIVDQNDNVPDILYPPSTDTGLSFIEMVPPTSEEGSLVTKVVAVDADSGHNAWLSYHFIQTSETSLFTIDHRTGEIRTARSFQEKDTLRQKVVIMVKDNGNPYLSATVTLNLFVAENVQTFLPELNERVSHVDSQSDLQMYLIIALGLISFLFILTILIVVISKCKDSKSSSNFGPLSTNLYSQVDPRFLSQYNNGTLPLPYSYNVCVALDGDGDFTFRQPVQNVPVENLIDADDSGTGNENKALSTSNIQQAQPNTDWRFSQAQRPGTSGAQPTEEAGVWPNNQFETERLQAMILASANEAAEGTSALGGGTGTMGLSARYGPQFTLQHVPDYRQNIYIPGTTSTLTNAAGKRDGKGAGPSGNKKKSGKKEKK